jgi:phospholipid/cholesterol/gamma-HCH transport system ATP-binding protein
MSGPQTPETADYRLPPEAPLSPASPPEEYTGALLRFERVTVSFDDEKPALADVSFEMRPGETLIILGAAGSGKTVLLKTALGLLRPTSGRIRVFGQEISRMREQDLFEIRAKIGVLFQEGGLFDSMTVEENVGFPLVNQLRQPLPPEEVRRRVIEALEFVELGHTLDKFPSELSGGMRRRVGIARATVTEPPLVLFDSPTAGLDPITSFTIMTLILKARDMRNVSTVIVTHRYQDAQLMANFRYNPESGRVEPASASNGARPPQTEFMVLREGRLVFAGTQAELEASEDPYIRKFVKR